MVLKSLYLRNFRNFEEITFDFGSKLNIFYGANAQGKTNLLEAIVLLSTTRSFRTDHLSDLVCQNTALPGFFLEATILRDQIIQVVRLSFDGKQKQLNCNGTRTTSWMPLLGLLPFTLYAPRDLDLIDGAPAMRRRLLNLHLAQSDPLYMHHYVRFGRALKQRNALLKSPSQDGIEYWESEMACSATILFEKRKILIQDLNVRLSGCCQLLFMEPVHMKYIPSFTKDANSYLIQLRKNRDREQQLGLTLAGPHRDDFCLFIEQKPAQLYASEGQKRCAIAALRLAEWQRLQQQIEAPPLFGVDDFELHLDRKRQDLFRRALEELGQVFITTPHDSVWPEAKRFEIIANALISKI